MPLFGPSGAIFHYKTAAKITLHFFQKTTCFLVKRRCDTLPFCRFNEKNGSQTAFRKVPKQHFLPLSEHFCLKTATKVRLYRSRLHSEEHFCLKTATKVRLYRSRLHSEEHFCLKTRIKRPRRKIHSLPRGAFWLKNRHQSATLT